MNKIHPSPRRLFTIAMLALFILSGCPDGDVTEDAQDMSEVDRADMSVMEDLADQAGGIDKGDKGGDAGAPADEGADDDDLGGEDEGADLDPALLAKLEMAIERRKDIEAALLCKQLFECPNTVADQFSFYPQTMTQQDCATFVTTTLRPYDEAMIALGRGRQVIDEDEVDACLATAFDASSACDDPEQAARDLQYHRCSWLFDGVVEANGGCTSHGDCLGADAFCSDTGEYGTPEGTTCSGTCYRTTCFFCEEDCAKDGERCNFRVGECAPYGDLGDDCYDGEGCADALVCDYDVDSLHGTCVEPKTEGGVCKDSSWCAEGFACDREVDARRGVCQGEGDAGDSCDEDTLPCKAGLRCLINSSGQSKCVDPGAAGQPCPSDEHCQDGLYCARADTNATTRECAPFRELGDVCLEGLGCEEGLLCLPDDAGTLTCRTKLSTDETCSSDDTCEGDLYCEKINLTTHESVCAVRPILDEECQEKGDCADGLLCDYRAMPFVCADATGLEDAPCDKEEDCQDGFTCESNGTIQNVCVFEQVDAPDPVYVTRISSDPAASCGIFEVAPYLFDIVECPAGFSCLEVDYDNGDNEGVCGTPRGQGERCYANNDCAAPLMCNFTTRTCEMTRGYGGAIGEECLGKADCDSYYCENDGATGYSYCKEAPVCALN